MKNFKFALPIILIAGLSFGPAAFASTLPAKTQGAVQMTQEKEFCDIDHASDVCVVNHSGQHAYISIEQFGIEKDPVSLTNDVMDDYYADEDFQTLHVTIYNSNMDIVFDKNIINHGPILELISEKNNPKKLAVNLH